MYSADRDSLTSHHMQAISRRCVPQSSYSLYEFAFSSVCNYMYNLALWVESTWVFIIVISNFPITNHSWHNFCHIVGQRNQCSLVLHYNFRRCGNDFKSVDLNTSWITSMSTSCEIALRCMSPARYYDYDKSILFQGMAWRLLAKKAIPKPMLMQISLGHIQLKIRKYVRVNPLSHYAYILTLSGIH